MSRWRLVGAMLLAAMLPAAAQTVGQVFFILRPDVNGVWYVQDDADHASVGVDKRIGVVQGDNFLRVYFDPVFDKAGVVSVTTDDDFAGSVQVGAGLGTQNVTFTLRAYPYVRAQDPPINPIHIWDYVRSRGGGNLWVSIKMTNFK